MNRRKFLQRAAALLSGLPFAATVARAIGPKAVPPVKASAVHADSKIEFTVTDGLAKNGVWVGGELHGQPNGGVYDTIAWPIAPRKWPYSFDGGNIPWLGKPEGI